MSIEIVQKDTCWGAIFVQVRQINDDERLFLFQLYTLEKGLSSLKS